MIIPNVIKKYKSNTIIFSGSLAPKFKGISYFEDSLNNFNWILKDSVETIGKYKCKLAQLQYRGRSYNVWYDPTIPLSEGPFKFNGLPGLIIKVSPIDGSFSYTLKEISTTTNNYKINSPLKIIGNYNFYKVEKKEWLKKYYQDQAARRSLQADCMDCAKSRESYFFIEKEIDIVHELGAKHYINYEKQ